MRYLSPEELLLLVAAALRERVVPDCGPESRGQVWAAIGILENVAARVQERPLDGHEPDDRALLADLDTTGGWDRTAAVVRRREAEEQRLRRPTNFGEIFRREGDDDVREE